MRIKLIIGSVIAGLLLLGGMAGVALAQEGTPTPEATPQGQGQGVRQVILEELAAILGMDVDTLRDAVAQARQQVLHQRLDEGMTKRLERLVEAGRLTQEEADEVLAWWQERPEVADQVLAGLLQHHRGPRHPRPFLAPRVPWGQIPADATVYLCVERDGERQCRELPRPQRALQGEGASAPAAVPPTTTAQ